MPCNSRTKYTEKMSCAPSNYDLASASDGGYKR